MRITIEPAQLLRLEAELRRAGGREIGGVLVGEHLGGGDFRLVDFSVQRRGGGRAHFNRDPVAAAAFVDRAIREAGGDPLKVNYLGEWHSHPGMSACPSTTDMLQMQAIMESDAEVATFGALIVASVGSIGLEISATLFRAGHPPGPVVLGIYHGDVVEWRHVSPHADAEGAGMGPAEQPAPAPVDRGHAEAEADGAARRRSPPPA